MAYSPTYQVPKNRPNYNGVREKTYYPISALMSETGGNTSRISGVMMARRCHDDVEVDISRGGGCVEVVSEMLHRFSRRNKNEGA